MKPYLTRFRLFLVRSAFTCVLICSILNIRLATAQSLELDASAPLHQGNNQALIENHYYCFYAEPDNTILPNHTGIIRAHDT